MEIDEDFAFEVLSPTGSSANVANTFSISCVITLCDRDPKPEMQRAQRFSLLDVGLAMAGLNPEGTFLLRKMAARFTDRTTAHLQGDFNELLPFNFSILKVNVGLSWDRWGMPEAMLALEAQVEEALRESWHKSLSAQWLNNLIGLLNMAQAIRGLRGSVSSLGLALNS
mmetsp:Transcript_77807/g.170391  ORF Transcript_77807/g.170391 Transcript_77807/m.170391 type:complete len:169 (+) Transcript_77807:256-762(+)